MVVFSFKVENIFYLNEHRLAQIVKNQKLRLFKKKLNYKKLQTTKLYISNF